MKGAVNFHEPVDPVKLRLPTYNFIIKHPMDLSTVKKKLLCNLYNNVNDFIADMDLIFFNCRTFNGVESPFGKMGLEI